MKHRTKKRRGHTQKMAHHCWALLFLFSWGLNLKCAFFFLKCRDKNAEGRRDRGYRRQRTLKAFKNRCNTWKHDDQIGPSTTESFFNYLSVNLTVFQTQAGIRILRSGVFFSSLWNLSISAKLLPVGRCFYEKQIAWICYWGIYFLCSPIFS